VLEVLARTSYVVSPDSDRVGLRLRGDPVPLARTDELPSEGIVLGAVQVPPDGQPVVFLADHPTTGGYPVVAVVDSRDLWQCAQLRPGESVGFTRAARR
jgi:allophanate hydrolase subunit 2